MACTCGGNATPQNVVLLEPDALADPEKRYVPSPCADCVAVMLAVRGSQQHLLVLLPEPEEN